MTISFSNRNELEKATDRLKTACDKLGIRLGKGDDKVRKLVCAVLNERNWDTALSAVEKQDADSRLMIFKGIITDLLENPDYSSVSDKSYLKSMLIEYDKMESFEDVLTSFSSSISILSTTTSALCNPIDNRPLDSDAQTLVIMINDFATQMTTKMDDHFPSSVVIQIQAIQQIHIGAQGIVTNKDFTLDECIKDAKKYETRRDWFVNSKDVYDCARDNLWLNACTPHMRRVSRVNPTLDEVLEMAEGCKNLNEFMTKHKAIYHFAARNNWLTKIKLQTNQ
ncbi:hypothetical protein [Vibrio crassostreae]|uniref:hypothetical protein n=1 Tax=Vibrio crassostreae TaxID=246167 RepID=UPI001B304712|nr:hypothetical protein [Vibrio crassostreae]